MDKTGFIGHIMSDVEEETGPNEVEDEVKPFVGGHDPDADLKKRIKATFDLFDRDGKGIVVKE